jgi:hypothetical protein
MACPGPILIQASPHLSASIDIAGRARQQHKARKTDLTQDALERREGITPRHWKGTRYLAACAPPEKGRQLA